ncbi:N-acetyldiaminopimelate deacetylase [Apilactobacillus timberlakei]|uniref:N-acetyldiaminopimelate deacetylase n=1 Tax=Apilactobacillus timberlakei TaxID=2008380 RepID=A0ABY2YU96_9LACO|nr:N-acetyldiaminopimelate deacetylase [Apilactobacillus timberlakei]TPR14723.1 N-acetyldiaminopimelate deacetylase [Apilactobacillus timberlakei]TPR15690.1 N-acetyldiaminopimelate deacetylase [Apilactobacillus timberlakei]TPR16051.1 N-acetyldiaminopimelate deacetylase [Apilactobacillus timberlakei]
MSEMNLIDIRRHLHQIPELALHENQTHDYLLHIIGSFKQKYLTLGSIESLPTAILVRIKGSNPNRTIGYRTDIDALPIEEKTNLPFSSIHPGVMHACGHDVHMTVALGILHYFTEHQPKDNLVFFFQPAEESESGGRLAYEANAFSDQFRINEFYGLHDNPSLPAGSIGCRMGTLFAGTTEINIDLTGKGGHAAYPQNANDMVVAAAQLISQIQTIISRSIDPIQSGVITLGKIEAGTIRNVIAGHARIEGTIRGLTQSMIELIDQRLKDICHGIELSYNCKIDLELNQGGYYPVKNNSALTKGFINFMKNNSDVDFIETQPAMTGEDFGYLLSKIPGTMFWLGVGDDSSLHTATLTPDESSIGKGVNAITSFLENRMKE